MTTTITTNAPAASAREHAKHLAAIGRELGATIARDPARGTVVFTSDGASFGAVATRLDSGKHSYVADETDALGGDDLGANPVELALGGLIACQAVTYRVWAGKLGIALDDVKIHAEGDLDLRGFLGLDPAVRPGFREIRLVVTITGPESEGRYQELRDAVDQHCPVFDLFSHATPVATSVVIG